MITLDSARELALSLPDATEHDHRGRPSFRAGGKIFATLWPDERRVVVKLTLADQEALEQLEPDAVKRVPGGWGGQGWTSVFLDQLNDATLLRTLRLAHSLVTAKRARRRR